MFAYCELFVKGDVYDIPLNWNLESRMMRKGFVANFRDYSILTGFWYGSRAAFIV